MALLRKIFAALVFCSGFVSSAWAQIITTIAGTGIPPGAVFSGDGGPATAAPLDWVKGIRTDNSGNVYFADEESHRIRKIDAAGIISTVAGSGGLGVTGGGYSGDGGPATAALLKEVLDLAFDAAGNMYIADYDNNCIRKVDTGGTITTFAGINYAAGYFGDGMPATAAVLYYPVAVTVDGAGNVYISDTHNYRIRKVDTDGIIWTIAGTGTPGYSGDGGPATAALISSLPLGIITDAVGNIYFADRNNNVVRRIDTLGIITTVAGTGLAGTGADGIPATASALNAPTYIAFDSSGNLFVSDGGNNRIRKVSSAGIINTVVGNGAEAFYGDDSCAATFAALYYPMGIAVNSTGNIYIGDFGNGRIRKTIPDHAPAFIAGHVQHDTLCSLETALNLNAALAITDADAGQTETWTPVTMPAHGTLVAGYTATSTGAMLTPTGMSYTPAAGFTGNDTFRVMANDCANGNDTTAIVVTVANCALLTAGLSTGAIGIYPNPVQNELTITSTDKISTVTIINLVGQTVYSNHYQNEAAKIGLVNLQPGVYLVRINGTEVRKFVKE